MPQHLVIENPFFDWSKFGYPSMARRRMMLNDHLHVFLPPPDEENDNGNFLAVLEEEDKASGQNCKMGSEEMRALVAAKDKGGYLSTEDQVAEKVKRAVMKMESGKGAKWQDRRFHLQEGLRPHDLAESVPRLLKDGFGHALRAGRDAAGNSLLHWAVEGVSAQFMNFFGSDAIYICPKKFKNTVGSLVKVAKVDVDARNKEGKTPLAVAAQERGCDICIEVLLDCGADPWIPDGEGQYPVHLIVDVPKGMKKGTNWGLVKKMLTAKSDSERAKSLLASGEFVGRLVHGAMLIDKTTGALQQLMELVDKSAALSSTMEEHSCDLMQMAAISWNARAVKYLCRLAKGLGDLSTLLDEGGGESGPRSTPLGVLFNSVKNHSEENLQAPQAICSTLLQAGCNPNARDEGGLTVLCRAAECRWRRQGVLKECVHLLLSGGADPLATCLSYEHGGLVHSDITARRIAELVGNTDLCAVLKKAEANHMKKLKKKRLEEKKALQNSAKSETEEGDLKGQEAAMEDCAKEDKTADAQQEMKTNDEDCTEKRETGDEEETEDEMVRRVAKEAIRKKLEELGWMQ